MWLIFHHRTHKFIVIQTWNVEILVTRSQEAKILAKIPKSRSRIDARSEKSSNIQRLDTINQITKTRKLKERRTIRQQLKKNWSKKKTQWIAQRRVDPVDERELTRPREERQSMRTIEPVFVAF